MNGERLLPMLGAILHGADGPPLVHAIFTALTISIMLPHSAWEADLRIGNPREVF